MQRRSKYLATLPRGFLELIGIDKIDTESAHI
jgi:hypothetical protein